MLKPDPSPKLMANNENPFSMMMAYPMIRPMWRWNAARRPPVTTINIPADVRIIPSEGASRNHVYRSRNPNPKNIVTVENIQRIKLTAYGEDSSASIGIQL